MRALLRRKIVRRLLWTFGLGTLISIGVFWSAWVLFPFPEAKLEAWPRSIRLQARDGGVLRSRLGHDDQDRWPIPLEKMNPWVVKGTIAVEDERFHHHGGVDFIAVARAALQNIQASRVVSGASTITMQVCRMLEPRRRTLRAKLIETLRAWQLESLRDKRSILETYLNVAPYGGNRRGIEVAAGEYFGKNPRDLSLGEATLLVGLPQSPERFRPDRYLDRAVRRRATVLGRMVELGMITPRQRRVAEETPLRLTKVLPRDDLGFHATWAALARRPEGGRTTLDRDLQRSVERLVREHAQVCPESSDIAVVALRLEGNELSALVGSADARDPEDGQVNGALAWRSPGSTLKPFIYGAAFESGRLSPSSTVHDIPVERGGWQPRNFDSRFAGPLTVTVALQESRNVPALLVLEAVGVGRCRGTLEAAGITWRPGAPVTGLTLATGGAEVRLVDLVNAFATLGREGVYQPVRWFVDHPEPESRPVLEPRTCRALTDILSTDARCPAGFESQCQETLPWFMWKTGTSSGQRDAWAVGHNGRYAIGVWIGRFSGESDPAFLGAGLAEPLLARVFGLPTIRAGTPRREPADWIPPRPLPPPREMAPELRILSPESGSVFRSVGSPVVLRPRANRGDVQWFFNGRLIELSAGGVAVPVGRHELRCIDGRGASAVRFVVK